MSWGERLRSTDRRAQRTCRWVSWDRGSSAATAGYGRLRRGLGPWEGFRRTCGTLSARLGEYGREGPVRSGRPGSRGAHASRDDHRASGRGPFGRPGGDPSGPSGKQRGGDAHWWGLGSDGGPGSRETGGGGGDRGARPGVHRKAGRTGTPGWTTWLGRGHATPRAAPRVKDGRLPPRSRGGRRRTQWALGGAASPRWSAPARGSGTGRAVREGRVAARSASRVSSADAGGRGDRATRGCMRHRPA